MEIAARKNSHLKYARAGFTLMEILIAVMIIGLLGAMIGPALFSVYKNQQISATQASLKGIKDGIDMYKMHTGQYPNLLKDLVKKPKSSDERIAKKWRGPYVGKEGATDVPDDSFGNKLYYKLTPGGGKRPYELKSWGPNGKGSPKEEWISVWDE